MQYNFIKIYTNSNLNPIKDLAISTIALELKIENGELRILVVFASQKRFIVVLRTTTNCGEATH